MSKKKIIAKQTELNLTEPPAEAQKLTQEIKEQKNLTNKKKTLDQIWGIKDARYSCKSAVEYKNLLRDMTDMDLRNHCFDLNTPFYPDRALNLEKLLESFEKYKFQQRIYPAAV